MLYNILGRQVVKDDMFGGAAVLGVSHEQMTEHSEFIPLLLTTTSTFFMHLPQIMLLKRLRSCVLFSSRFVYDITPGDGGVRGRGSGGC